MSARELYLDIETSPIVAHAWSLRAIPVRACPNCQSTHLQKRGWSIKQTRRYRRYQCQGCGTWTTDTRCDPDMKLELMGEAR